MYNEKYMLQSENMIRFLFDHAQQHSDWSGFLLFLQSYQLDNLLSQTSDKVVIPSRSDFNKEFSRIQSPDLMMLLTHLETALHLEPKQRQFHLEVLGSVLGYIQPTQLGQPVTDQKKPRPRYSRK